MGSFNHQKALDQVLQLASVDPDFRRRLIANPHVAITAALGDIVPAALKLRFVERDPDVDVMCVLPDLVRPTEELSLDDLDVVAGGTAELWSDDGAPET
jgi:hypothetical protein